MSFPMRILLLGIVLCFQAGVFLTSAQPECFKGVVTDASSGHPVPNVHVWEINQSGGAVTDSTGFFELCGVDKDNAALMFSHTSYRPLTRSDAEKGHLLKIELKEKTFSSDEVVITGERQTPINRVVPGGERLTAEDIERLPTLLGEPDIVKALQQLPGVQSVSEGVGGIYVRGGGPGQNQVWFNGMELMNPLHLMGIYSVFNPITTKGVDIYKGHTPVSIRSGLSSAIDVSSDNPLKTNEYFQASLGNIASNIALSQKSDNGKFGILAGFRRSYLELYETASSLFLSEEDNYFAKTGYHFYDFNGSVFYRPRPNSTLSLSWYLGADDFSVDVDDVGYDAGTSYGNRAVSLQWKTRPAENMWFQAGLGHTEAWSRFSGDFTGNDLFFKSRHQRSYLNTKMTLESSHHLVNGGVNVYYYETMPQDMFLVMDRDTTRTDEYFRNGDVSIFLEDTYKISSQFRLYAGIRGLYYTTFNSRSPGREVDSNDSGHHESAKGEFLWSPSVSLSWRPRAQAEYKMAWARNVQTTHLASLSSMPLPNDIWMMATPRLSPQYGHQLSFEYKRSHPLLTINCGVFGRLMRNQTLFNVQLDEIAGNFEDQFWHGKGRAYGFELSLQKKRGLLQGGIHYTLSKSERSYPEIDGGEWFNDKFDRIHDLSATVHYNLNEKWDLGGRWIYATGSNMTLPSGRMWMMGTIMNDYEGFNNFRLPPYHRLDLTANLILESGLFKESILNFSLINVYNRANPYFIFYKVYKGDSRYDIDIRASQVSLFPFMPSVSWRVKF